MHSYQEVAANRKAPAIKPMGMDTEPEEPMEVDPPPSRQNHKQPITVKQCGGDQDLDLTPTITMSWGPVHLPPDGLVDAGAEPNISLPLARKVSTFGPPHRLTWDIHFLGLILLAVTTPTIPPFPSLISSSPDGRRERGDWHPLNCCAGTKRGVQRRDPSCLGLQIRVKDVTEMAISVVKQKIDSDRKKADIQHEGHFFPPRIGQ